MQKPLFLTREDAGESLAQHLLRYRNREDVIVLALPRGGVPVAVPVSEALGAPLDVMIVRKLGLPGRDEFAMGAVASGGVEFLDEKIVSIFCIKSEAVEKVRSEQLLELKRREQLYRGNKPWPDLHKFTAIIVDDGIATGATLRVAIEAVKRLGVKKIVVAVPVAPEDSLRSISVLVDETVCLFTPMPFIAVGKWYANFGQTSDAEVRQLLQNSWQSKVPFSQLFS